MPFCRVQGYAYIWCNYSATSYAGSFHKPSSTKADLPHRESPYVTGIGNITLAKQHSLESRQLSKRSSKANITLSYVIAIVWNTTKVHMWVYPELCSRNLPMHYRRSVALCNLQGLKAFSVSADIMSLKTEISSTLYLCFSRTLKQLIKVCKAFVGILLQTSSPATADAAVQLVGGEVCTPVMKFPRWWGIYHRVIKIVSAHNTKWSWND